MIVTRVKLDQKLDCPHFSTKITTVNEQGVVSVELCDTQVHAEAYNIIDGKEIPFRISKRYAIQEYEAPEFSSKETKQYKDALYSEEGLRLLNRIKNLHLIRSYQAKKIFQQAGMPEKLTKKILAYLWPIEMKRRLDFSVEEQTFNRISLKDLCITKAQVMNLFISEGLIYGKT